MNLRKKLCSIIIFAVLIIFPSGFKSALAAGNNSHTEMFQETFKENLSKQIIKPTIFVNDKSYVITTGSQGNITVDMAKGVYEVSVAPIPGVDIFGPQTVNVSYYQIPIIYLGLKPGSGKVNLSGALTGASANYTIDQPLITVFYDKNGNGKKDKDERILPWDGLKITLNRISTSKQFHLTNGWNAVAFSVLPANFTTASQLLLEIAKQKGDATTVARWHNGKWEEFVTRGKQHYGFDFTINPTEGYFIRNYREINFAVYGTQISQVTQRSYNKGYNFVGLIFSRPFSAMSLMEEAKKQTTEKDVIKSITRHESGLLESVIDEKGQIYGNDFTLNDIQGYFLRFNEKATLKF